MTMKSLHLKRKSRPLMINVPLALLLTLTIVWSGSVGLAGNVTKPLKSPSLKSAHLESESAAMSVALTSGPDSDVLEMQGDWLITFGGVGRTLSSGHYVPPPPLWADLRVHLDRTGPGDFGGHRFKGYYSDAPWLGSFEGETFYDGWGIQLVQIRYEEPDRGSGHYYKLLSGKHENYMGDPSRVEVFGGYVEVGAPGADTGLVGNFVMVKQPPPPAP